jgi:hypothetical protein
MTTCDIMGLAALAWLLTLGYWQYNALAATAAAADTAVHPTSLEGSTAASWQLSTAVPHFQHAACEGALRSPCHGLPGNNSLLLLVAVQWLNFRS